MKRTAIDESELRSYSWLSSLKVYLSLAICIRFLVSCLQWTVIFALYWYIISNQEEQLDSDHRLKAPTDSAIHTGCAVILLSQTTGFLSTKTLLASFTYDNKHRLENQDEHTSGDTEETPAGSDFSAEAPEDSKHCHWGLRTLEIRSLCTSTLVEPRHNPRREDSPANEWAFSWRLESGEMKSALHGRRTTFARKLLLSKAKTCLFRSSETRFIEDNVIPTGSANVYWERK